MSRYDTVILDGRVVVEGRGVIECGIGIKDGRIATLAADLTPGDGDEVVDAGGKVVFPGAVDCHYHLGIYRPISEDAESETRSSLVGGTTSVISYFRTGSHYLNRTGSYREIFPLVLESVEGRAYTDFGFHLAPMSREHLDEVVWLAGDAGVSSFKYYMFYKGLNLSASSTDAASYTMTEDYDLGHLLALMEKVAEADQAHGERGRISLSIHCENSELIKLFIERVRELELPPLEAYSRARPPLTERLSIHEAGVLAEAADVRVNFLHLSGLEALEASRQVRSLYPRLDLRLETTVHHLSLTYDMLEGKGLGGKVNPPIRTPADVEGLWAGVFSGEITWVASDHACCLEEMKGEDLWPALPGFGGTALLYPVLITEGHLKRGLPLERVAELASTNPARAYACYPQKGTIAVGSDADLTLIDIGREQTVSPSLLLSAQDHTPFSGIALAGWPSRTLLRGRTAFLDGDVVGTPDGQFLRRPLAAR
jgi:dihydropyrimidinase/allantoinase